MVCNFGICVEALAKDCTRSGGLGFGPLTFVGVVETVDASIASADIDCPLKTGMSVRSGLFSLDSAEFVRCSGIFRLTGGLDSLDLLRYSPSFRSVSDFCLCVKKRGILEGLTRCLRSMELSNSSDRFGESTIGMRDLCGDNLLVSVSFALSVVGLRMALATLSVELWHSLSKNIAVCFLIDAASSGLCFSLISPSVFARSKERCEFGPKTEAIAFGIFVMNSLALCVFSCAVGVVGVFAGACG